MQLSCILKFSTGPGHWECVCALGDEFAKLCQSFAQKSQKTKRLHTKYMHECCCFVIFSSRRPHETTGEEEEEGKNVHTQMPNNSSLALD